VKTNLSLQPVSMCVNWLSTFASGLAYNKERPSMQACGFQKICGFNFIYQDVLTRFIISLQKKKYGTTENSVNREML
jgi:hypothetical protein